MKKLQEMELPILIAARNGTALENYTIDQLMAVKDDQGRCCLAIAARYHQLHRIRGGITADQLAAALSRGTTALHVAAGYGSIHLIVGGATLSQLMAAKSSIGTPALFNSAFYCRLDEVTGGVTFKGLVETGGRNLLGTIVASGSLHQLVGGVCMDDLNFSTRGFNPLQMVTRIIKYRRQELKTVSDLLVGCPEAVTLLDPNCEFHCAAARIALTQAPRISECISPEMTAQLL